MLSVLEAYQRSLEDGTKATPVPQAAVAAAADCFVHESSHVDAGAEIGAGTNIWHYCHISGGSQIGRDCRIGQNIFVARNVTIGDAVKIQNNVSVYEGVTLEDHVFCGPSIVFTNVYNPRSEVRRMEELRKTLVRRGATLGANCTVLCGVTVGEYAFVGAGAVVLKDVPDFALVVGNPGRVVGWMCACGHRIEFDGDEEPVPGSCRECKPAVREGRRTRETGSVNVPLLDLRAQYRAIRDEVREAIDRVCDSQHFILGHRWRPWRKRWRSTAAPGSGWASPRARTPCSSP